MPLQYWYWIIIFLWLIFGFWREKANPNFSAWIGGLFIELVLFVLIGFKIFGGPLGN